jgi:hypothetical protein
MNEIYIQCCECENIIPEKYFEDHYGLCESCHKKENNIGGEIDD